MAKNSFTVSTFNLSGTTTNTTTNYQEGGSAVFLAPTAVFATTGTGSLTNDTLTISGLATADTVSFNTSTGSPISISGSNILDNGTVIGSFTGGTAGSNLVITLNHSATASSVQDVLKNLLFSSTNTSATTENLTFSFNHNGTITSATDTVNEAAPVCFLQGTRILTRTGYRPVEELAIGDEVRTLQHGWQPIRWIGHMDMARHWHTGQFPETSLPIRIRAGAFGPNLPERDVCVSPGHALYFRNHLIPAQSLVNGETVVRDAAVESIRYFHVLLDQHAVVFSEGLPTESYIPVENIEAFENADTCPRDLAQKFISPIGGYDECYPRVVSGAVVETARAYLARQLAAASVARAVA